MFDDEGVEEECWEKEQVGVTEEPGVGGGDASILGGRTRVALHSFDSEQGRRFSSSGAYCTVSERITLDDYQVKSG